MTERKELSEAEKREIAQKQVSQSKQKSSSVAAKTVEAVDQTASNPSIFGLLVFGICCFCLGAQYTSTEVWQLLEKSGLWVALKEASSTVFLAVFALVAGRFTHISNTVKGTGIGALIEKTVGIKRKE